MLLQKLKYKILYATHLLVLEMVQSALMISKHLHGNKFELKINEKTKKEKKACFTYDFDMMEEEGLNVSALPL